MERAAGDINTSRGLMGWRRWIHEFLGSHVGRDRLLLGAALFSLLFSVAASGQGGADLATPQRAEVVARFQLVDGGDGSLRPVSIGLALKRGLLASGGNLWVSDEQGRTLPSQWNPLTTWRTDGSVLHGVMSFEVATGGLYEVRRGAPSGGAALTFDDLKAVGDKSSIEVVTDGKTYSIELADLLRGSPAPRQKYLHFTGPLAGEFVLGGVLREGGRGVAHPTLQGYFHVRAFGRPVARAQVTFVLENTGAFSRNRDIVGDVAMTLAGQPVYQISNFVVGADKRYPKRAWWGEDPKLWVRHDTEQIQSTGLVPAYREVALSERLLERFPRHLEWHQRGQLAAKLDDGGAGPHLAPLDRWTAAYLISADRRAYDAMLAHADAYHWMVSKHNYAMRPRDEKTGFPLNLRHHPDVIGHGWGGPNALPASPANNKPLRTDMAHQPSCAYVPYLVTAEFRYLEQCQFWAVANWLMERPGSYKGWPRSFYTGQVRSVAWGFRNLVNAAVITPDKHPLKQTLDEAVEFALQSMDENLVSLNPLGLASAHVNYKGGRAIAPWQDDFLTWSIGSAVERGYPAPRLWPWKAKAVVGRLGGEGDEFCWADAAAYALSIKPSKAGETYSNWSELYRANFPERVCPPAGQGRVGIDRSATDYGAQMAGAISVAVDTGVSGALEAWERYNGRQTRQWGERTYAVAPEWAVVPRTLAPEAVAWEKKSELSRAFGLPPAPEWIVEMPSGRVDISPRVVHGDVSATETVTTVAAQSVSRTSRTFEEKLLDGDVPIPKPIRDLELHRWTPISENTLADVDPCPARNCGYNGVEGQKGVLNDWTGGVYASQAGPLGSLIYWGGGHNGYYGSEVYAFDLQQLRWVRRSEPTTSLNPSSPTNLGLDKSCRFHDGAPVPAHTYDSVVYDPEQNRFYVLAPGDDSSSPPGGGCGSGLAAFFDFDTNRWGSAEAEGSPFFRRGASGYDPKRKLIWARGAGRHGVLGSYDPVEDKWRIWGKGHMHVDIVGAVSPSKDVFVIANFRSGGGIHVLDLHDPGAGFTTVATSGDREIEENPRLGFEWVPELEGFIAWNKGKDLFLLKPPSGRWWTDTPWVWQRIVAEGAPPSDPVNGPFSKFQYIPEMGIALVATNRNEPVYAIRLVE